MWFAFLDVPRDQTKMWCEKKRIPSYLYFSKVVLRGHFKLLKKKMEHYRHIANINTALILTGNH